MTAATVFRTAFGWCGVVVCDGRVVRAVLPRARRTDVRTLLGAARTSTRTTGLLAEVREAVVRYFAGERVSFDVPLDLSQGTPFQRKAWRAALAVPYGEVRTYGQIAALAGRPRAARAVGRAMAANPLPILVPCHRIVAADGLGGFMGGRRGVALKARLLALEGAGRGAGFAPDSLLTRRPHVLE